jgi:hypothetical protein
LDPDLPDTILKGDHLRTIVTKFGFNWPSSFRREDLWMKSLRRTDDGRTTDGRTTEAKRWQNITLATARWAKKSVKLKFVRLLVCWNSYTPRNEVAEGILFPTSPRVVGNGFVSYSPLKLLNGISWNMVVLKDMTWRYVYRQEILIRLFF